MDRPANPITVITGTAFEDTIDGYFPLRESLRQMLLRNRFGGALVFLLQAPAMEIPGLPPDKPVPLYITDGHGCLIHEMAVFTQLAKEEVLVSGVANWFWWGNHRPDDRQFSDMHRLAEPAFVRGVGFNDPGLVTTGKHQLPIPSAARKQKPAGGLQVTSDQLLPRIVRGEILRKNGSLVMQPNLKPDDTQQQQAITFLFECDGDALQQRIMSDIINDR